MSKGKRKWDMVRLGDVCDFIDYRGKTPEKSEVGIPLITAKNVKDNAFSIEPQEFIPTESYDSVMTRGIPRENDILFTTEAPLGNVCRIPRFESRFAVGQRIIVMQPKQNKLFSEYLEYSLKSDAFQKDMWKHSSGSTVKGIRSKELVKLTIPLPPRDVQKHIADTLDKTQEIIDGHKKQLEELDNLIKAVFYEMFGDPVTNEKGWEMSTLGECCDLIKDGPHISPNYVESGVPFISVNNIISGYWNLENVRCISKEDYEIYSRRCKPEFDDILYTKGGTTGFAKYVDVKFDFMNWVHIAVLKYKKNILKGKFLEQMLNSGFCYTQSQKYTRGIANRDLVLSQMAKIKIFVPRLDLQTKFAEIVTNIEAQKALVKRSITESQTLFNSLMSEYFD